MISQQQITKIVKACLDDQVISVSLVHESNLNLIFKLELKKNKMIAFKTGTRWLDSIPWFKRKFLNEASALKAAAKYNLPVPKVLFAGCPDELYDYPYCGLVWLNGYSTSSVLKNRVSQFVLGKQAGVLLKTLHQVRFRKYGFLLGKNNEPVEKTWSAFLHKQLEGTLCFLQSRLLIPSKTAKTLRQKFESLTHVLDNTPASLLHGDVSPANFLIDNERKITGFLDFEFARAGDPLWDLVYIEITQAKLADFVSGLKSGYEEADRSKSAQAVKSFYRVVIAGQKMVSAWQRDHEYKKAAGVWKTTLAELL